MVSKQFFGWLGHLQIESKLQVYTPGRILSSASHNIGVYGGLCNRNKM